MACRLSIPLQSRLCKSSYTLELLQTHSQLLLQLLAQYPSPPAKASPRRKEFLHCPPFLASLMALVRCCAPENILGPPILLYQETLYRLSFIDHSKKMPGLAVVAKRHENVLIVTTETASTTVNIIKFSLCYETSLHSEGLR